MDVEFAEQFIHALEDGIALRWRHVFDQHVTTQRMGVRSEAPDMNVMDFDYAVDLTHRSAHFAEFQPTRKAFQQHVQGLLDDIPSRPNDQYADQYR